MPTAAKSKIINYGLERLTTLTNEYSLNKIFVRRILLLFVKLCIARQTEIGNENHNRKLINYKLERLNCSLKSSKTFNYE